VATRQCQLSLGEAPVSDDLEVGLATLGEAVEERVQRPAGEATELGEAVKGLERPALAVLQDDAGARDPVGLFAVDEMADHVERAPSVGAFVGVVPWSARAAEEASDHGRSAFQDVECLREVEAHRGPLLFAPGVMCLPNSIESR